MMEKLKKHQFIPFLDVSGTVGGTWKPVWKRIDLSTIFDLDPKPQTETMDYISQELPVEEVARYQPQLPQEVALYEGDAIYDFVFNLLYELPVGSGVQVPMLMCFGGSGKKAWQVKKCTLVLGSLNTVSGKLSFTLHLGGDIERGTYSVADGAPVFAA